jgi:hypothetical protein
MVRVGVWSRVSSVSKTVALLRFVTLRPAKSLPRLTGGKISASTLKNKKIIFSLYFDPNFLKKIVKFPSNFLYKIKLEVTIARKMLPHPQGIKGSMHNSLNKGLFI